MYTEIRDFLNAHNVKLIAVSKTRSVAQIMHLYDQGQRAFGENRVQELMEKQPQLPGDIEWHLIGHLQKNKVKYIAPFIHLIHSADDLELIQTIQKEAYKNDRTIRILLQFHIADEQTKFGLAESDIETIMAARESGQLPNILFCGVMGMATLTDDKDKIRSEFRHLKTIFENLKSRNFCDEVHFREISMGMSGDYEIAVEEGATMVRLGTVLF